MTIHDVTLIHVLNTTHCGLLSDIQYIPALRRFVFGFFLCNKDMFLEHKTNACHDIISEWE